MAKGIVSCNTRTQQGRTFIRGQVIRNCGERLLRGHDILGVSAVEGETSNLLRLTMDKVAAAAGIANETMAAMPAHPNPLVAFPKRDVRSHRVHPSGNFVSGHTGIGQSGPQSLLDQ